MQTENSRGGGWTEEGEEDKAGDGEGEKEKRTAVSGERRVLEDRRKPGTSRFCYDQWQTGTQRAPFVSIQGKDCYVGLSVECLSRPGHLIRPRRGGSFVFLVFQTPATARRIFLLFVRFIARPLSSALLLPFTPSRLSAIVSLRHECDTCSTLFPFYAPFNTL